MPRQVATRPVDTFTWQLVSAVMLSVYDPSEPNACVRTGLLAVSMELE